MYLTDQELAWPLLSFAGAVTQNYQLMAVFGSSYGLGRKLQGFKWFTVPTSTRSPASECRLVRKLPPQKG